MSALWEKLKKRKNAKDTKPELSRSRYSLVSCSEVTADTLQLWLELPEEVKYDPALEQIRQIYEKEHGQEKIPLNPIQGSNPRLHNVKSAPSLGSEDIKNGQKQVFDVIEEAGDNSEEKISENVRIRKRQSRIVQAKYYTKMSILLACWMFFTAMFLMYNEKEDIVRTSFIAAGEEKNYTLHFDGTEPKVFVKLTGPFLSENAELKLNSSQFEASHKMVMWLERELGNSGSIIDDGKETTKIWTILLQDETSLDFNIGVPRSRILRLEPHSGSNLTYALKMNITAARIMPFTLSYKVNPLDAATGVLYSCVLLCGLYILIIFEVVNRTMAAITVATTSLAVLALAGERPTLPEVISWLDQETLVLLFSMMLLVAIMAETGIFDFLAVYAFEITKGKLWPLIYLLCITTGVLSTFLDNVTTVLLMSPVTIRLCEVMDLDPVPILMFMAMYSNIGGTATPVGDPPNVIVASNKAVIDAGINFTNFTAHMALGIVFVTIQTSLQIRFMFRDTNKLRLSEPRDIQELRHQISIWRRAADSLPHLSSGVGIVRERLERKISKLQVQLKSLKHGSGARVCPSDAFQGALREMKEKITKGKLWPLIYLLCITTGVLSTFLDNVTTVLLMSPVTIRLCEVMDLDPVPILMFMAMYSNIGGTATPVGDPPNVIVASNKAVIDAGINFTNFTAHMALGIVFVTIQTSLQIRFMFRDTNKLRLSEPRDIQELRHQISIWRRAADSLPHLSSGVGIVRERLERKISKLQVQLKSLKHGSGARVCPSDAFQGALREMKEKYKIRDKVLLIKSSVAITFVVLVFFLHSIPELNRVSLGWTALLGAILLLLLADRADLEPILHRVEWSTLLFFAALFVLMEALSKLGLILYIGGLMEQIIIRVNEDSRLAVAILLIIWVSGVISACVDNIPLTTMMVRVVVAIGSNPALNLPMGPLIWALLYGACLGGNGTLIGASANVVCAGVAEQHGYKFTFGRFLKVGLPIMIGHLIVASVYLLVCHCVFAWH